MELSELRFEICRYLSPSDFKSLACVNSGWYFSCLDEQLWKLLVHRDFNINIKKETWINTYKDLISLVIIVVTTDDCYHCHKPEFLNLVLQLESIYQIDKLNFQSLHNFELPSSYPAELQKYLGWFPTILIFTKKSWNQGSDFVGNVYNGHLVNDNIEYNYSDGPLTFENVVTWIKNFQVTQQRPTPINGSPPS